MKYHATTAVTTLPSRIPSLDGLRALSILLVIVSHLTIRSAPGGTLRNLGLSLTENGMWGVSVFFVISGFLITTLLMREGDRFGQIDLGAFYLRRCFRILPAFFAYLGAVGFLACLRIIPVDPRAYLHAITMTSDYSGSIAGWFTAHTWSLSVEEQFYLVWPLLFLVCSRRALAWIAASVIALDPLIRLVTWFAFRNRHYAIRYMAHTRADVLMYGCLAALLFGVPAFQGALAKLLHRKALLWAALGFLLVGSPLIAKAAGAHGREFYMISVGFTIQGACITLLMLYVVLREHSFWGRMLNSKVLKYIGVRSYSLYLWQQLFIGSQHFGTGRLILGLGGAALAAEASYRFIELPMLRVRHSFKPAPAHIQHHEARLTET